MRIKTFLLLAILSISTLSFGIKPIFTNSAKTTPIVNKHALFEQNTLKKQSLHDPEYCLQIGYGIWLQWTSNNIPSNIKMFYFYEWLAGSTRNSDFYSGAETKTEFYTHTTIATWINKLNTMYRVLCFQIDGTGLYTGETMLMVYIIHHGPGADTTNRFQICYTIYKGENKNAPSANSKSWVDVRPRAGLGLIGNWNTSWWSSWEAPTMAITTNPASNGFDNLRIFIMNLRHDVYAFSFDPVWD